MSIKKKETSQRLNIEYTVMAAHKRQEKVRLAKARAMTIAAKRREKVRLAKARAKAIAAKRREKVRFAKARAKARAKVLAAKKREKMLLAKAKAEARAKVLAAKERQKLRRAKVKSQVFVDNYLNEDAQSQAVIEKEIDKLKKERKSKPKVGTSKWQTTTPYSNPDEAQIIEIESNPPPCDSKPKRIGYFPNNKFQQTEPYKYAVVKMPQINSPIKLPRIGRSDNKGAKENDFLIYLNEHFKSMFDVSNSRHVLTRKGRPYEPDFVISSEKDNKNIFIDIEIDEPYDLRMRTPTHNVGENDLRDDFFIKRGWIVIRFAERQIHYEPLECCALIAKVINSIDSTFNSYLLMEANPAEIEQWDSLQAKKWASKNYREEYLKTGNSREWSNCIYEYNITESENDRNVEKEVSNYQTFGKRATGYLADKYKNDIDKRISFDPKEHKYFIDGNPDTISVTQLIDKFFPEFDSLYWSREKAKERLSSLTHPESEENILSMQSTILNEWAEKSSNAAKLGTELHEAIENYYNKEKYNSNTTEFKQFLSFKQQYKNMIPFRSEWRIFDEDLLVAGTIDMVYKREDGLYYMFDWKRSEKVVRNDGTIINSTFQFAFGELGHLGDNSYNKYCLQQNIYKAILEKRYNLKISTMNLLVMHEKFDRYHRIQIPNMDSEVKHIFSYRRL